MDIFLVYEDLYVLVEVIIVVLYECDVYICFYCDWVMCLVQVLGEVCGLFCVELKMLYLGVVFYDIGKIGVFDVVLFKLGCLIVQEWELMKVYVEQGECIFCLVVLECVEEVVLIICYYYEFFDGSGYFDGLKGEGILLLCWILLVVDGYDVMVMVCFYYCV